MVSQFEEMEEKLPFEKPDHIAGNVFLGALNSAIDLDYLKENKIGWIACTGINLKRRFPEDIQYLNIEVQDEPTEDLTPHFDPVVDWIVAADSNVLVHCKSGISRSASFVTAYLIREEKMSYEDADKLLKEKRPRAYPNPGFRAQLQNYANL